MKKILKLKKKTIGKLVLLLTIVMAIGCTSQTLDENNENFEVSANLEVGMVSTHTSFDATSMQLPESIAIDHHGNIYLSMSPLREIWKLNPDGTFIEVVANFVEMEPGLLGVSGLQFDPNGNLYVAISSTNTNMKGVWKISSGGEKVRIAGTENISLANDLAIMPNGTIYITDSAGVIWRYMPGEEAEVWIQDASLEGTGAFGLDFAIGANGIVATKTAVIVANTEKGQLVNIPVLPDKSAGTPEILNDDLFGIDGLTSDASGEIIYAAVNAGNKVVRINSDGSNLIELASGAPLDFPTSLAFGTGKQRHTLFITNFAAIHFLNHTTEDAKPAVIALGVMP
ncbi:MAG TPA: SMP-30/gluconolactonase/LRE family protein [Salinimicrobium sp.]|nr:SMP-30/gluconolactonase/LRE family protein [Salinimicrobium sp.]